MNRLAGDGVLSRGFNTSIRALIEPLEPRQLLSTTVVDSPATPDPSFGDGGSISLDVHDFDQTNSIVALPGGKILVAGHTNVGTYPDGHYQADILRFNADGTLDTSFGQNGIVRDPAINTYSALAVEPDGSIVAGSGDNITIVRYHADGSLDTTFGQSGYVSIPFGIYSFPSSGAVFKIVPMTDGRLFLAGYSLSDQPPPTNHFECFVRLNSDGSLDTTFDATGKVSFTTINGLPLYTGFDPAGVDVLDDGSFILAGTVNDPLNPTSGGSGVIRFNSDGTVDSSFGVNGLASSPNLSDSGPRYTFVFATPFYNGDVITAATDDAGAIMLTAFQPDGSIDPYFCDAGSLKIQSDAHYIFVNQIVAADNHGLTLEVESASDAYQLIHVTLGVGSLPVIQLTDLPISAEFLPSTLTADDSGRVLFGGFADGPQFGGGTWNNADIGITRYLLPSDWDPKWVETPPPVTPAAPEVPTAPDVPVAPDVPDTLPVVHLNSAPSEGTCCAPLTLNAIPLAAHVLSPTPAARTTAAAPVVLPLTALKSLGISAGNIFANDQIADAID